MNLLPDAALSKDNEHIFLSWLLKEASLGIYIIKSIAKNHSVILAANDVFCQLTGLTHAELIGQSASSLLALLREEDQQKIQNLLDQGAPITDLEFPWLQKDGSQVWAITSLRRFPCQSHSLLVGISKKLPLLSSDDADNAEFRQEARAVHAKVLLLEQRLQEQQKRLQESHERRNADEKRFHLAMSFSGIGLLDIDWAKSPGAFRLTRNWLKKFGLDQYSGALAKDLYASRIHPEDIASHIQSLAMHLEGTTTLYENEYRMKDAQGNWLWVSLRAKTLRNKNGLPVRTTGLLTDITALKQRDYQATHDEVTELYNHRGFTEKVSQILTASSGSQGVLLSINIDDFKVINDVYGYEQGNEYLLKFALYLQSLFPPGTLLARSGADEYLAFFFGSLEASQIAAYSSSFKNIFLETTFGSFFITASGGLALTSGTAETAHELIQKASLALHQAKDLGKSTFCLYEPAMQKKNVRRHVLKEGLNHAFRNQEFFLAFQPIYQVIEQQERIYGYEVLLRWKSPSLGLISPNEFIPLVEESNLILSVGEWTLREACRVSAQFQQQCGEYLNISVNVSVRQLAAPGFVNLVCSILEQSNLPARCLTLEITESIMMADTEKNVALISQLRNHGVSIALDDFGTGYSSFTYLQKLPISILKIDKSLIDDITSSQGKTQPIIASLIHMSKLLGYRVVTEGVESQEQLQLLLQNGCEYFQGYFFSKPLPQSALQELHQQKPKSRLCLPLPSLKGDEEKLRNLG
nr:EAL domain-containing protein [uncultured Anaeromusa sp.]